MSKNLTFKPIGPFDKPIVKKPLAACCETDILAGNVYNADGEKLVSAYTIVTEFIKNLLAQNCIRSVTVYCGVQEEHLNNADPNEYYRHIYDIKTTITQLSAGCMLDCDRLTELFPDIMGTLSKDCFAVINGHLQQLQLIDHYTYGHSLNVGLYAMLLAGWLGMTNDECAIALQAGLLHDIGKEEIPADILKKQSALSMEEFGLMKKHPIFSYMKLVDCSSIDPCVRQAVLHHHERLNKTGYPLATNNIGAYARMIAIADVYDAMTSDRVYKQGVTPFRAFEFFQHQGAELFEQRYLKVFIDKMSSFLVGATVETTAGDTGRIVYSPPTAPFQPVVAHQTFPLRLLQNSHAEIAKVSAFG